MLQGFSSHLLERNINSLLPNYRNKKLDSASSIDKMVFDGVTAMKRLLNSSSAHGYIMMGAYFGGLVALFAVDYLPEEFRQKITFITLFNPVTVLGVDGFNNKLLDENCMNLDKVNHRVFYSVNLRDISNLIFHGIDDNVVSYKNSVDCLDSLEDPRSRLHLYRKMPRGSFRAIFTECSRRIVLFGNNLMK